PAVPVLRLLRVHQPKVRFVDERGGLERLARLLLRHPLGRQLAQLVVDQRQQLRGGGRVALLDGAQDTRDVGHSGQSTARGTPRLARRWPEACALRSLRPPRASPGRQRAEVRHTAFSRTLSPYHCQVRLNVTTLCLLLNGCPHWPVSAYD